MPRTNIFYRGDTRGPEEIKRDGFQLQSEAMATVQQYGGISGYMLHQLNIHTKDTDVQRWVITGKDKSRPTISTAKNEGCGGYGSGYIYKIDFGNDLTTHALDGNLVPFAHGGNYGLRVYMNTGAQSLATAQIIALSLKVGTKEVAFLTPIPSTYITEYRDARLTASTFQSMLGVTAAQSTAPKKLNRVWPPVK